MVFQIDHFLALDEFEGIKFARIECSEIEVCASYIFSDNSAAELVRFCDSRMARSLLTTGANTVSYQ